MDHDRQDIDDLFDALHDADAALRALAMLREDFALHLGNDVSAVFGLLVDVGAERVAAALAAGDRLDAARLAWRQK